MKIIAHKTREFQTGDTVLTFTESEIPSLPEKSILAITSKIVSLSQKRLVAQNSISLKDLLLQETDRMVPVPNVPDYWLTESGGLLSLNAGIDTSNVDASYLLLPEAPFDVAAQLWRALKAHYGLQHLGILLTDSRTNPFYCGSIGRAVAWCGFDALNDYRGQTDMLGNRLENTVQNVVEPLAAAAVLEMGEADECCPLATITDAILVAFRSAPPTDSEISTAFIHPKNDLYINALAAFRAGNL